MPRINLTNEEAKYLKNLVSPLFDEKAVAICDKVTEASKWVRYKGDVYFAWDKFESKLRAYGSHGAQVDAYPSVVSLHEAVVEAARWAEEMGWEIKAFGAVG